jgi:hypothetical protein
MEYLIVLFIQTALERKRTLQDENFQLPQAGNTSLTSWIIKN